MPDVCYRLDFSVGWCLELIPSSSCDVDNDETDEIHRMEHDASAANRVLPTAREINVPALGKHWKTICAIRLQIQKPKATSTSATTAAAAAIAAAPTITKSERTIRILKSNQHPEKGCCVVHIKDTGVE